jgi:hypothetical protein
MTRHSSHRPSGDHRDATIAKRHDTDRGADSPKKTAAVTSAAMM